jgi:uncharacterized RDD family membrane protein YckC
MIYASPWRRLVASFFDGIITTLAGGLIFGILQVIDSYTVKVIPEMLSWFPDKGPGLMFLASFPLTAFNFMYFSTLESSDAKATIGKQLMGIQVVDLDGKTITRSRSCGRYFSFCFLSFISIIVLTTIPALFAQSAVIANGYVVIGGLMTFFTKRSMSPWDSLSKTVVIDKTKISGERA